MMTVEERFKVALAWVGTSITFVEDHIQLLTGGITIAYTLWQWWVAYKRTKKPGGSTPGQCGSGH